MPDPETGVTVRPVKYPAGFTNTFSPGDFSINRLGGCRLNPQLARCLVDRIGKLNWSPSTRKYIQQLQ